jgi:hypothetical protein
VSKLLNLQVDESSSQKICRVRFFFHKILVGFFLGGIFWCVVGFYLFLELLVGIGCFLLEEFLMELGFS